MRMMGYKNESMLCFVFFCNYAYFFPPSISAGGVLEIQTIHHPSESDKPLEVPERRLCKGGVLFHLPG